jgi:DNA-binding MarR family transcriptional regulator
MEKYISRKIVDTLLEVSDQLRFLARRQGMEHGMSVLQMKILHYLEQSPRQKCYSGALQSSFQLTNATLSGAVKVLKSKKLVQAQKDKEDRRKIRLQLTDWGKKVSHITRFYTKPVEDIIAPLPKAEQAAFLKKLEGIAFKLRETFE